MRLTPLNFSITCFSVTAPNTLPSKSRYWHWELEVSYALTVSLLITHFIPGVFEFPNAMQLERTYSFGLNNAQSKSYGICPVLSSGIRRSVVSW